MRMYRFSCTIAVLIALLCARDSVAQTVVKVNLSTRSFESPLPFGEPFLIRGAVPASVDSVVVRFGEDDGRGGIWRNSAATTGFERFPLEAPLRWIRGARAAVQEAEFSVPAPNLRPDVRYVFEFNLHGSTKTSSSLTLVTFDSITIDSAGFLRGRGVLMDTVPPERKKSTPFIDRDTVIASTRSLPVQRFDADLGIAAAHASGYVGLVSNAHLYPFAPVNKATDLRTVRGFWPNFRQRVSIFAGLALQELNSDAEVHPLYDVGTPVVGAGLRGFLYWSPISQRLRPILQPLRLNAGVIFFEQEDPNPLVTERHGRHDLFASVTADIELKSVLGPLLALF